MTDRGEPRGPVSLQGGPDLDGPLFGKLENVRGDWHGPVAGLE
jgi:hypothetical protein